MPRTCKCNTELGPPIFFFFFIFRGRINLPNLRGIEEHKYEAENCAKTRSNNRVPGYLFGRFYMVNHGPGFAYISSLVLRGGSSSACIRKKTTDIRMMIFLSDENKTIKKILSLALLILHRTICTNDVPIKLNKFDALLSIIYYSKRIIIIVIKQRLYKKRISTNIIHINN